MNQFNDHINLLIPKLDEKKVYVAVSGGIDSMVLYHLCYKNGLRPIALHCNFKLRDKASDLDENLVKLFSESNNLVFKSKQFDTLKEVEKRKLTIQECARALRYEWFDSFLNNDKNAVLLTGHHLNDNIETFFLNIMRGTGLKGLTGIPEQRDKIFRPLLQYSKSEITNYAQAHNVPFREDESNKSKKYLRNKIRHSILPEIEANSSNFQQKMNDLLSDLTSIEHFLISHTDNLRTKLISNSKGIRKIEINELINLPSPILHRLLRPYGIQRRHISEIEKLCHSSTGATFKNDQFVFLKDRTFLLIKDSTNKSVINFSIDKLPITLDIGGLSVQCSITEAIPLVYERRIAYLDFDKISLPIHFTNQFHGLKIQPYGMNGSKLISDLLIDAKLSQFEKEKQLVVVDNNEVIWLAHQTINQKYCLTQDTKRILKIEILE